MLHEVPFVAGQLLPQRVDALTGGGRRLEHGGPPVPDSAEIEHLLEVTTRLSGPGPVGLVDHEDVRRLEEPGLVGLDGVTPFRVEHDDRGVGSPGHLHLDLADADRLDEHQGKARRGEHPDGLGHGHGQAAQVSTRRHRADEHAGVEGVVLHADAISENGTTGERRRGVDGEHPQLRHPAGAGGGDEPVHERGLTGTGRARDADGARLFTAAVGQGCRRPAHGPAALDLGQQSGQRHPVTGAGRFQQRGGIGGAGPTGPGLARNRRARRGSPRGRA